MMTASNDYLSSIWAPYLIYKAKNLEKKIILTTTVLS